MGKFEDKDWIGEAKDLQIGPDIRYAVKSKNLDFLRRILWGPLTLAEFREVTHRVRELEKGPSDPDVNIVKGNIIDKKELIEPQSESERTTKERSENSRLIIDIRL